MLKTILIVTALASLVVATAALAQSVDNSAPSGLAAAAANAGVNNSASITGQFATGGAATSMILGNQGAGPTVSGYVTSNNGGAFNNPPGQNATTFNATRGGHR